MTSRRPLLKSLLLSPIAFVRELFAKPAPPPLPSGAEILKSFDARDWAKAFVEHVRQIPGIATDEETMTTWFANALMRGYDEANSKYPHDLKTVTEYYNRAMSAMAEIVISQVPFSASMAARNVYFDLAFKEDSPIPPQPPPIGWNWKIEKMRIANDTHLALLSYQGKILEIIQHPGYVNESVKLQAIARLLPKDLS